MSEALEQQPTQNSSLAAHIATAYDLETILRDYVGDSPTFHDDAPTHVSHGADTVHRYTAASVLEFCREQATILQPGLSREWHKNFRIIPKVTALNGLRRYYDQIHGKPGQQETIYQLHIDFLKEHGTLHLDVHVARAMRQQLRWPREGSLFTDEARRKLHDKVFLEVFAAQSLALQTLRHSQVPIPRQRTVHTWMDENPEY